MSIGVLAAVRRGTGYDYAGTVLAVLGQSLPNFWLGIMLILLFGVTLRWLPTSGFQGWRYLVLPSITLAAFPTALVARLTRSSLLEILGQEYIRTGRAKGLAERGRDPAPRAAERDDPAAHACSGCRSARCWAAR